MSTVAKTVGYFMVEHWRDGALLNTHKVNNASTIEGRNAMLNTMFSAATQIAAANWHIGLIDLVNYGANGIAATDTYDNINQAGNDWDEATIYTDANNANSATTRPAWGPGAANASAVTNAVQAIYDITGDGTIKGAFACGGAGADTKGNHANTGILWATGLFTGDVLVGNGDQLKITYTTTLS